MFCLIIKLEILSRFYKNLKNSSNLQGIFKQNHT